MFLNLYRTTKNDFEILSTLELCDKNGAVIFDCVTLELPDKNNLSNISCIPIGRYNCELVNGSNNIPYKHISVTNVVGRAGVCIHIGNFYQDTKGCILVGKEFEDLNHDHIEDITNSKVIFDKLISLCPESFVLQIFDKF